MKPLKVVLMELGQSRLHTCFRPQVVQTAGAPWWSLHASAYSVPKGHVCTSMEVCHG